MNKFIILLLSLLTKCNIQPFIIVCIVNYNLPHLAVRASVTDLKGDREGLRAEVGHDLSISCDCRMSDTRETSLYSIKWYRDDREFFRYIPTGEKEHAFLKNIGKRENSDKNIYYL